MTKIVTIIGARPQFIKAATVSRQIIAARKEYTEPLEEIIIHTGQHFDPNMSDIFFTEMNIPSPKYQLNINNLGHGAMTGKMLEETEQILIKEKPDFVLVYGDTNSTLAGALAAKKLHIKVVHIEAGLRSFNEAMPEEINRIVTDRISDILFYPTSQAVKNLQNEGFEHTDKKLVYSGDVMYDAAMFFKEYACAPASIQSGDTDTPFALATIHRAENTDQPEKLSSIISAVEAISKNLPVYLPLHPRTKNKIKGANIKITAPNLHIIEPVSYLEMLYLLNKCKLVLTDSGGLQKEAYFFNKHCITLREETEWVELVQQGYNKLAGSNTNTIIGAYQEFEKTNSTFRQQLYGKGDAAEIIVNTLLFGC